MGSLVLLVVAAVWVAVLFPPLLRSRLENRPNSSVSDFRNQLSSLQRAMPSSRSVSMRSMARPLAPSPLARPAAAGRPPLRSGVKVAGGGSVRSAGQQAAMGAIRTESARAQEVAPRGRHHGEAPTRTHNRPAASPVPSRDVVNRRRVNVLFVLAVTAACAVFLAVTSKTQGMTYAAAGACLGVAAYLFVLARSRPRPAQVQARRPAPAARRHEAPEPRRGARRHEPVQPSYRGARASQQPPSPRRGDEDRGTETRTPARREHRSQPASARVERRPRRREQRPERGHDPRPSGIVYGEPVLLR